MFFKKDTPSEEKNSLINLFKNHISPGKVAFFKKYHMDFVMGHRNGSWLCDLDGTKKLFNLHSNGGVFNLGHRNKEISDVLKSQLNFYDIGNHHLLSKPRAKLAALLAKLLPGNLNYTIFGVSGGEAIDTAIKVARAFTKRTKIISVYGGYHGHTGLALQTGDMSYRVPFLFDSTDFIQVPFNDLESLKAVLKNDVAAVILETIPATLGMLMPEEDYLKTVKELCQSNKSLLILDEVQAGLGRTGKLWAFEHFDVIPDMVVLAKGLSGGIYPITATIINDKLIDVFKDDPFIHISTSGGAELGCAVVQKVLEITAHVDFLKHVNSMAILFAEVLQDLQKKHNSFFRGVRQKGLMIGLELTDSLAGPALTKAAYDNDLLLIYANNDTSVVQLLPSLVITETDIAYIVKQLDKALKQAKLLHKALILKKGLGQLFK
ncbi:MAG: aminotransferase class III-fold pyridoxal phosphate-dependent enzyme [Flavobacteriaceae bacterium]|nr:aminotransferase class III-fold pyridoxal phosphate-dependent enzyme [Flavobacteriaceae bacterium]